MQEYYKHSSKDLEIKKLPLLRGRTRLWPLLLPHLSLQELFLLLNVLKWTRWISTFSCFVLEQKNKHFYLIVLQKLSLGCSVGGEEGREGGGGGGQQGGVTVLGHVSSDGRIGNEPFGKFMKNIGMVEENNVMTVPCIFVKLPG